jgi:hypothetical protein
MNRSNRISFISPARYSFYPKKLIHSCLSSRLEMRLQVCEWQDGTAIHPVAHIKEYVGGTIKRLGFAADLKKKETQRLGSGY